MSTGIGEYDKDKKEKYTALGGKLIKGESASKATGTCTYASDVVLPHMLFGKILRSPHPRATIVSINTEKAEALKGVKGVLTYKDVPDTYVMHDYLKRESACIFDHKIMEKELRYVGECVAAVAAVSEDIAEEALGLIEVEYQVHEAVLCPIEAMKDGAPQLHTKKFQNGETLHIKNNIVETVFDHVGDVDKGMAEADVIIEEEFSSALIHNLALDGSSIVCKPHSDGRLEVWTKTQAIHGVRMNISHSLGIDASKVKVHRLFLGGAFGAYIGIGFIENICALLAVNIGQPVKMQCTREEDFYSQGRHPAIMRIKIGAKKDGTITAMDMWCADNTGAYSQLGEAILALIGCFFMSMYRSPNLRFDGYTVYTNTVPVYCMRGAGNPQQNWAVESAMDILADKLEMDPMALRLKNRMRTGDLFYGQGTDIVCTIGTCGTEEIYKIGAEKIGWKNRGKLEDDPKRPWIKRGIGMGHGFHTTSASSSPPSKIIVDYTGATIKFNEDGTANLITPIADLGTGNLSALAAMCAEELGLRYEDIIVSEADTDTTPYDCATHASRALYVGGLVVIETAKRVKKILFEQAARIMGVSAVDLTSADRRIFVAARPALGMSFKEVILHSRAHNWGTPMASYSGKGPSCPPSFTAAFMEVEVDTQTGVVKVVKAVTGADCGMPVDYQGARGQLIGGLHMGLGMGMTEKVEYKANGHIANPSLVDYKLLTPVCMPDAEAFFVETNESTGPFGAKGLGEATTNPVAACFANAVFDAVGVRITDTPVTPEKILRALNKV